MTITFRTVVLSTALVGLPAIEAAEAGPFYQGESYGTATKDETYLVLDSIHGMQTFDQGSPTGFRFELEVHHGVTERLDLQIRHAFQQATGDGSTADPGTAFHLSDVGARVRYRISDQGKMPIDVQLRTDVQKSIGASLWNIKPWLDISRKFGKAVIAVNPSMGIEFGNDMEGSKVDFGWAAGLGYHAHSKIALAAEIWGRLNVRDSSDVTNSIGPTLSWMPSGDMTVQAAAGFGITEQTEDFSLAGFFLLKL